MTDHDLTDGAPTASWPFKKPDGSPDYHIEVTEEEMAELERIVGPDDLTDERAAVEKAMHEEHWTRPDGGIVAKLDRLIERARQQGYEQGCREQSERIARALLHEKEA